MAREIARGVYGEEVRTVQRRAYWACGLWLTANLVAFGVLIWAQARNAPAPPQQTAAVSGNRATSG